MKKMSPKRRIWLKCQLLKKNRQLVKKRYKKQRKKRRVLSSYEWWDRSIDAPKVFDLKSEVLRLELIEFISSMHSNRLPKERLRLNFQHTERVVADAMLLFLANLERAVSQKDKFSRIRIAPPKNNNYLKQERIKQVLSKIGAFKLCSQSIYVPSRDETVMFWKRLSGNNSDALDGQQIHEFLEDEMIGAPTILSVAFKEALLNIRHHAFINKGEGCWWAFVHVRNNERTVVVCDLGRGIPSSITVGSEPVQKNVLKRVLGIAKRLGRSPTDSELIRGSVKYGKSGTGDSHRGKGLPKMKEVVDTCESTAFLNISSHRGSYTISSTTKKTKLKDYAASIGGTVVTWKIPINPSV